MYDYLEFLTVRCQDIEKVIDHHFELIKDEIEVNRLKFLAEQYKRRYEEDSKESGFTQESFIKDAKKADPELMWDKYSYVQKLEKLYDYETDLIKSAKVKNLMGTINEKLQDTREGIQNFCRMTGSISQSYFILD